MNKIHITNRLREAVARCSDWSGIQEKWADFSEKEKGDLFEALVQAYLQLEPTYASKLRHVWLAAEVPLAVAEQLRLPSTDMGIDLVAETHDGEFWAIQCKYRQSSDMRLSWEELSTFTGLAFGVCHGFSFGLVCSTTERVTHLLQESARIGFCAADVWVGLDREFLLRLKAHLGNEPAPLRALEPRPHQLEAMDAAKEHFVKRNNVRGKLLMPCGAGKSLTSYWIARELGARRIVVAVPSLSLVRQTLRVWLREAAATGTEVDWICVCSDESAGNIDQDCLSVRRQDIGVPCMTDPGEIAAWLRKGHGGLSVVFTTYQSGEALSAAVRTSGFQFELGIMDEAHKTVGRSGRLFSHLLHDANLSIARRLFMTATERRYGGQSETVLSMDDSAVYGDTFHHLSFKRAIEITPQILCDYKILTIAVSRQEVAELIQLNAFVTPDRGKWDEVVEADMLAALIALRKAMDRYPIRHVVSFHGSRQRAKTFKEHNEAFSAAFPGGGSLETFYVSGQTSTGERARILAEFAQAERALVTNARCLTEGVDVPEIDCVLFADPRRSVVDVVQAVGRALRPAEGKECGYVIVPVLYDAGATAGLAKSGAFQSVLETVRALAATDERVIEYFRGANEGRQISGGRCFEFYLDEKLSQDLNLGEFVNGIELKCWERLARLSWRSFSEAREFVRALGLKSVAEWRLYRSGKFSGGDLPPLDIPVNPDQGYQDSGWSGWGDWLGTGKLATKDREYREFAAAREFVRGLGLKNQPEWFQYVAGKCPEKGSLPVDIPSNAHTAYASLGWICWGDWLGTDNVSSEGRSFREFVAAREFARGLGLQNLKEWLSFCAGEKPEKGNLPVDVPSNPNRTYKGLGWSGYGDWLGTERKATHLRTYRSFEEAREFVRGLRLKNQKEWGLARKGAIPGLAELPADIPRSPHNVYAGKGWCGFGDWLGTDAVATFNRVYRSFSEARAFVRSLGLKVQADWRAYCSGEKKELGVLPTDIPSAPHRVYKDAGWDGFGDWLGTGRISNKKRRYRSFEEARVFARALGLRGQADWYCFCRGALAGKGHKPADIPYSPSRVYAGAGWNGFRDWLGTSAEDSQCISNLLGIGVEGQERK